MTTTGDHHVETPPVYDPFDSAGVVGFRDGLRHAVAVFTHSTPEVTTDPRTSTPASAESHGP